MEENIIIDTTDWISQLPEFIVHHILSFLYNPEDLVRCRVLSKKWLGLTASFPILDFTINRFIKLVQPINLSSIDLISEIPFDIFRDSADVRLKFWKYVADTLCRFCKENVSAHTFNLVTMIQAPMEVDIINRCIELSIKNSVRVLFISIFDHLPVDPPLLTYRLPDILLSASSLTSLTIRNCELPSSLMTDALKFKSLKMLLLGRICMNEEVIKHLITNCFLLEEFKLYRCYGFKEVCVKGLYNLQKVRIDYKHEVERIDIEAPNLSHLFLFDWDGIGAPSMNLASCKKLTSLSFVGVFSPNLNKFADFLTNFPFIETLFLTTPENCNNLKLLSNSLRTWVLHSKCDLDEIEINTPNLVLLKYSCVTYISEDSVRNPAKSKARLECYPKDVDAIWFQKLRQFLDKTKVFKVLKLHISATSIDVEKLNVIPSYELEHVELEIGTIKELSVYVAVVDGVLWCCRPRSLTLKSEFPSIDFGEQSHVIKSTYEKLLQQEDKSQMNIQIVLSCSLKPKKYFSDLNSLLTALPLDQPIQTITFTKEEVAPEEGCIESISEGYANVKIA